eukprot:COSAG05_NODE_2209_length_3393_cov_6.778351_2_plen_85_part_00
MNERSSRSHSVFQLQIEGQNALTGESNSGVLNLIDLAGSERLGGLWKCNPSVSPASVSFRHGCCLVLVQRLCGTQTSPRRKASA